MAFKMYRSLEFLAIPRRRRYLLALISSSSFSNVDISERCSIPENHSNSPPFEQKVGPNEQSVLKELSDLLSIDLKITVPPKISRDFSENCIAGDMLSSDEKLRGIFLQKLNGKFAVETALSNVGVVVTQEVVKNVFSKGNLDGEAIVTFFNWAIKQPTLEKNIQTYNIVLRVLGRRKFFNFMEQILFQMNGKGLNPNKETLSIIIDSYVRAHRVSRALQAFGRLGEYGIICDTDSLNVLLACLCERNHVGTATSSLNIMRGKIPFTSTTYNVIIGGWSKMGRVDKVERYWKEMIDYGLTPNSLTFSYLLEALGRSSLISDAIKVYDNIEDYGFVPDTITYNAMIFNFISVGDLDESMNYYKKMLEHKCLPNSDTYTRLVSACMKVRRIADALELFEEMLARRIYPSTGTITSFIKPLCSFGPPHAALMVYRAAKKSGCVISLKAYKLLLMRLSRFGKCGTLLNLWEEMQESGYSPDVEAYEYIIDGLCNIGQLENAVLITEECLRRGFCPNKIIYSKLNNRLLDKNKVEIAYKLSLKIKTARRNLNARRYWRSNGWHF